LAAPIASLITLDSLHRLADGGSFARGLAYYQDGRVLDLAEDGDGLTATVLGTRPYEVALWRDGRRLGYSCTCPLGEESVFCKHCVATALAWREGGFAAGSGRTAASRRLHIAARPQPSWWDRLAQLNAAVPRAAATRGHPREREIVYTLDASATLARGDLTLEVANRVRSLRGQWGRAKPVRVNHELVAEVADPLDRQILSVLAGPRIDPYGYYSPPYYGGPLRYVLSGPQQQAILPLIAATGRCRIRHDVETDESPPLEWDDGPPWQAALEIQEDADTYRLTGVFRRDSDRMDPAQAVLVLEGGFLVMEDRIARIEPASAAPWVAHLRRYGPVVAPRDAADQMLAALVALPDLPAVTLPDALRYEEVRPAPRPLLRLKRPSPSVGQSTLSAELSFDYDGEVVRPDQPGRAILCPGVPRRVVVRDNEAERGAIRRLRDLGAREVPGYADNAPLQVRASRVPQMVRALIAEGWRVEAEGYVYRTAGPVRIAVRSGTDWFELHGTVEFGDEEVGLPAILAAARKGERFVRLGDGGYGVLPEEWLARHGLLVGLGKITGGHVRFARTQVLVLDALLAALPEATADATIARARERLHAFDGIHAADAPPGFTGALRGYQREGLGWLLFLQRFGLGGCLADDMGLGKTIMVLALMAARADHTRLPSLVVVPKSLVFNWRQEARRFTPGLRVLEHGGVGRLPPGPHFRDYDLILTTYGTLRRDIAAFAELDFDYIVLDEAQAIKNAATHAAKAARLLRAEHRLVLTGTPVENHVGELWSLLEFLNPGMVGSGAAFRALAPNGDKGDKGDKEEAYGLLARALRPVILRRTKEQVIQDLPPKVEQTLYCDLEPSQRAIYEDLRRHYRRSVLDRVRRQGLARSRMHILEALLRLRQAACHVGLIDRDRRRAPSGKLEVLHPRLAEVVGEGHKALVFSQFTSLLAIVRERLDREGLAYEYLDGKTRDRAAPVQRFAEDAGCRLFLVSLKAGGLGLNLTAADYVFLLDPWWNPAVEAQAVDRTHRIGQTRPVFAYRLIARDTIEEKILALQDSKRSLVDSLLGTDGRTIGALTREDLELLLS
jgi:superfamily II DNA or RNA helicase